MFSILAYSTISETKKWLFISELDDEKTNKFLILFLEPYRFCTLV
jgi:hypothetical protein